MSASARGHLTPLQIVLPDENACEHAQAGGRTHDNNAQLVCSILDNDPGAFQIIFTLYSRLVFDIAKRILRNREEAEEVVQEVFLYIHRKAALFDPGKGVLKAWVIQVAYHRALDRRRYLSRIQFYSGDSGADVNSLADTLQRITDPEREIESKLSHAQLERAIQELPKCQRTALKLFYFRGLTLREISERLNEPLPQVRHHYYRGLAKLRRSALVQTLRGCRR